MYDQQAKDTQFSELFFSKLNRSNNVLRDLKLQWRQLSVCFLFGQSPQLPEKRGSGRGDPSARWFLRFFNKNNAFL